jgi:hypothetical protein
MHLLDVPTGVFVLATLGGLLVAVLVAAVLYEAGFLRSKWKRRAAYVINIAAYAVGYTGTFWLATR